MNFGRVSVTVDCNQSWTSIAVAAADLTGSRLHTHRGTETTGILPFAERLDSDFCRYRNGDAGVIGGQHKQPDQWATSTPH
jgi:hypothetical protein